MSRSDVPAVVLHCSAFAFATARPIPTAAAAVLLAATVIACCPSTFSCTRIYVALTFMSLQERRLCRRRIIWYQRVCVLAKVEQNSLLVVAGGEIIVAIITHLYQNMPASKSAMHYAVYVPKSGRSARDREDEGARWMQVAVRKTRRCGSETAIHCEEGA